MELIEIRKVRDGQLPFTKNSCYKFHSLKKFPEVIYKVGGKLFFDMDEWRKMAEKAKKDHVKKAAAIRDISL